MARMLSEELRCGLASFGDYVREQAKIRGIISPTGRDLQNLGQRLVDDDIQEFCRAVLARANFAPGALLVVDGIRHVEALAAISTLSHGQPIRLIYLETTAEVRTMRESGRTSNAAGGTSDAHQVEKQTTREVRQVANLVVDSSDEVSDTFRKILDWIRSDFPQLFGLNASNQYRKKV